LLLWRPCLIVSCVSASPRLSAPAPVRPHLSQSATPVPSRRLRAIPFHVCRCSPLQSRPARATSASPFRSSPRRFPPCRFWSASSCHSMPTLFPPILVSRVGRPWPLIFTTPQRIRAAALRRHTNSTALGFPNRTAQDSQWRCPARPSRRSPRSCGIAGCPLR
jgi:hypothetical protein